MEDPDASKNLLWVDIAGFEDSSGKLIEYINTFIDKKIFQIAKDVRILIPFTEKQFKEERG